VDQEIALPDHQAVEYRLRIAENEPELRVMMAYTDPLGTITSAKALVNDLDLIVIGPDGKRYFGNHGLLEANVSREGGAPDRVNNVENVFLDKPTPGVWRIVVVAHRIAWDEHRGTTARDQDFALVVSGVEPNPVSPVAAQVGTTVVMSVSEICGPRGCSLAGSFGGVRGRPMSHFTRKLLALCLPPVLVWSADCTLALCGQPEAYWAGSVAQRTDGITRPGQL
jgi:hypothetical protein